MQENFLKSLKTFIFTTLTTLFRYIASDDLIENNQKQIKLLEEDAQRLYKEWFVHLRFPGYKNVKIVDGVPEGWNEGVLGDIAKFKRGKTITKAQVHDGDVPVIAGGFRTSILP